MYDLIGDIHGHADALVRLLEQLGYVESDGVFRHPTRRAVFLGDYIDRGPQIAETLRIVRAMVNAESAIALMGNHEFNALAFHLKWPDQQTSTAPDAWVRPHTSVKVRQHAATLEQFQSTPESCSDQLRETLEWFRTLPMWLELDGFRAAHACWDREQIQRIAESRTVDDQPEIWTDEFLFQAGRSGTPLFKAVEEILKGKEIRLPPGSKHIDKDGHARSALRAQWYRLPDGETFRTYALPPNETYPNDAVTEVAHIRPYDSDEPPMFCGHYWLRGERPELLATNICCLDWSVAKDGMLCGYRWDGEAELSEDKFVWVPAAR
ncbi:metallophosphoesterase [Thalassoroseus pseudoceratinae]|uniref:metallophosphoesterase n=1 Tax=Thalassoroseus pseudoceratinae TaxID=2713176 RepID=UPI00141F21EA|nr:metallophosphoesterase [Thalassoroseus pseudoceratinae]